MARPLETTPELIVIEQIYRLASVGLCLVDTRFRFVSINERLAAINGLSVQEHIGRTVEQVLPDLADRILSRYRRVLASGRPNENFELCGVSPAQPDEERTWLASDLPVQADDGTVTGIITVVQDITELKRSDEDNRTARARLAEAERVTHLGCWEWNLVRDELWWSEQQYRILGRDPETFTPSFEEFVEHVVPEDRPLIREQLDAVYAGKDAVEVEYRAYTTDGSERVLRARGSLRRDPDGEPRLLFGTTQDVTEERWLQEAAGRRQEDLRRERDELARLLEERTLELDRLRRRRAPRAR